jgi:hypothetical protein
MTALLKKDSLPSFPRAKIERIVQGVLPKGRGFKLLTADSGVRQKRIVRIVTAAWKDLRPPERISRVLKAMNGQLSEAEQDRILRVSVLTPTEYRDVVLNNPPPRRISVARLSAGKNLAAKRRSVARRNPKRARAK